MQYIKIDSSSHVLYKAFEELYSVSFPVFEQRTETQQEYAFSRNNYHLIGWHSEGHLIGFISYWEFKEYLYIEHFAVNTGIRGKGYGTKILNAFIESIPKIVLLEIDPITDEISKARLRFYERCGFYKNPHSHKHPAYRDEYQSHSLIILTTKRVISEQEYLDFSNDLNKCVMNLEV